MTIETSIRTVKFVSAMLELGLGDSLGHFLAPPQPSGILQVFQSKNHEKSYCSSEKDERFEAMGPPRHFLRASPAREVEFYLNKLDRSDFKSSWAFVVVRG